MEETEGVFAYDSVCVCVSISFPLSLFFFSLSLLLSITYLVLQFHEFPPVLTRDLRAQLVPKGIGGRGGDREEVSGEEREYRGVER